MAQAALPRVNWQMISQLPFTYDPNEYGTDLEGRLLLPREVIGLRSDPAFGTVTKLLPDAPSWPFVITNHQPPQFSGLNSGQRSGLLVLGSRLLKFKGCNIEAALETEGEYKLVREDAYSPEGGQLLSNATEEVQLTSFFNELLKCEGFPVAYEPAAIISYSKAFKRKHSQKVQQMGASVMNVKGDTRLPELFETPVFDNDAAVEVANNLGRQAGAILRLTESRFSWHIHNSHVGNYIVFVDGESVCLYACDVEASRIRPSKFDHAGKKRARARILDSLSNSAYYLTGNKTSLPYLTFAIAGLDFGIDKDGKAVETGISLRDRFRKGFEEGYANPDSRKKLPIACVNAAFGLHVDVKGKVPESATVCWTMTYVTARSRPLREFAR